MKQLFLLSACLILYANVSSAQQQPATPPTYKFSLADCINYAYEHQDSVKNAKLDVKNADYKVNELLGQGLPQINGSAQFQDYLQIPTTLIPNSAFSPGATGTTAVKFGVTYQSSFGATLDQKIFDPTYLISLKNRNVYKELFTKSLTRTRIETTVSVTKAYYQVLVSNEQIKLLDANIEQLKQQLDQTTQQNKQGFVEKIDVDRLAFQYNSLMTNRENVTRSLVLNYELLKFQIGMPIKDELVLTDKLTDVNRDKLDEASSTTDSTFYKNRIEYSLLQTNNHLNEIDLKRKKSMFLPTLSFFGNFSSFYQDNAFGNLFIASYPTSYIGLRLTMPLFTGLQHYNQVREAKITLQKSQNDLENAKNAFALQASVAHTTYINALHSFENQKRNRDLAQEILRVSKIKYGQGVGSSIEVTQAQTAVDAADNQYIQALFDALISKVDMDKAYGRIN